MPDAPIQPLETIKDALIVDVRAFGDSRGLFMETFRKEWFPNVNWDRIQANCSISRAGVLRGLHYHHHQVDYWFVTSGAARVGLADLRPSSPTFKHSMVIELSIENHLGLFIPQGVAHGFLALTDVTLTYLVNNYYDGGKDENGVAWDDATLQVPWNVQHPLISERDAANPRFSDIASSSLPV